MQIRRPGKKIVIRLNPEFSRELKVFLAYIRDFRYKVLYIIKKLKYEIAKGSIESEDEVVNELQGTFDIVLNILLNAVVEVTHSPECRRTRVQIPAGPHPPASPQLPLASQLIQNYLMVDPSIGFMISLDSKIKSYKPLQ